MHFSNLGLSQPILRALEQEGYTTPTPIQQQAIPPAMTGRDVLGCAQTGTGKTAAFALPILHRLSTAAIDKTKRGPRKARALILSPTRELACQIAESFVTYGRGTALDHTVIYGGVSQHHQQRAVSRGVDVIVATPGRLIDLMDQRIVDLSGIEIFVLDEADRMLDMGFIQPIRRIAAAMPPGARQTLLFSATMPKAILQLANSLLRDPARVSVTPVSSAAPLIEQALYMVNKPGKPALLEHLLAEPTITRALVFTRTKHGADRVCRGLDRAGISADSIHGNKSQPQRKRALDRFRAGRARVLVATDVAARGLDVDDISHVINYDLPVEAEAYVHRIGRTGRAGATGVALSFCDGEERGLLRDIERLTGTKIEIRQAVGVKPVAHEPMPSHASVGHHARPPHVQTRPHTHSRPRTPEFASAGAASSDQHPSSHDRGPNHRAAKNGSPRRAGPNKPVKSWHKPAKRKAPR